MLMSIVNSPVHCNSLKAAQLSVVTLARLDRPDGAALKDPQETVAVDSQDCLHQLLSPYCFGRFSTLQQEKGVSVNRHIPQPTSPSLLVSGGLLRENAD